MNNNKILSIIPARSGSKGFPGKNIINLLDKPLIAWTIEASLSSNYISKTIVSSDSDEILEISKNFGANVLKRPYEISKDDSSAESVVNHVLNELDDKGDFYDYIIYLQPTSPLRNRFHIDNAIRLLFKKGTDSIISVYEINNKYLKLLVESKQGYLNGISGNIYYSKNRQFMPKTFMPNGAIYICKKDSFLANNGFISNKTIPFLMSKSLSIDIDNKEDLEKVILSLKKIL